VSTRTEAASYAFAHNLVWQGRGEFWPRPRSANWWVLAMRRRSVVA